MATYMFSVRSAGVRKTGMTPTFVFFKKLSDGSDVTPPTVSEVAQGQYKFTYDPAVPASGQIDAGSTVIDPGDRYIDVACVG